MSSRYRPWFSAACLTLALAGYTSLSDRVNSSESIATSLATSSQATTQSLSQVSSNSYNVASAPLSQSSIASTSVNSASLEQAIKLLTLVQGWAKDSK